ncbi:MAG: hypothetical protein EOP41_07390 [Sphingobacteriaceae bacterium]|nr:MAG: hypothetical protein EOP41_07390 [Sphingobacteriaceae bacterium]
MKVSLVYALATLLYIISPIVVPCQAQEFNLSNFKKTAVPVKESKEIYRLNNLSNQDFVVSLSNGKLHITRSVYSPAVTYALPEGKLIGIDQGEFCGALFYKPRDSTIKHIYVNGHMVNAITKEDKYPIGISVKPDDVLNEMVRNAFRVKYGFFRQIFNYRDSLYEMEGLSGSLNNGAINNLQVKNDSVKISMQVKFDDEAPGVLATNNDVIYLTTLNGFYRIRNWHKELILDKLFWRMLYPTSVAVKDNRHIYVGIRTGYAMINAKDKKITYYQYQGRL